MHASTVRDGLTFTSTLTAPKGTHGQWYVIVHNAAVKPQTTLAISEIARYPRTKTESVTIPTSAFGSGCSLSVQVDVRFGGTRHSTTTFVPGGVHRATVTKPNCTPEHPKPPVTPESPPTPQGPPPTVVPPVRHVTAPPTTAPSGVSAAFAARAVPASVTFTG